MIIMTTLLLIFVAKPWEVPKDNTQRWTRSALTGISTAVSLVSFFVLLGLSESTGNCLKDIQNQNLGIWAACVMIPVFIVVTISHYAAYRQLIWLHSVRKKIEHKK
jgi:sterol desaturase/sphingolipid hydroxylase (fatty acid hydroxylase superfamily)